MTGAELEAALIKPSLPLAAGQRTGSAAGQGLLKVITTHYGSLWSLAAGDFRRLGECAEEVEHPPSQLARVQECGQALCLMCAEWELLTQEHDGWLRIAA